MDNKTRSCTGVGQVNSTAFLLQRLSIVVQKGNAAHYLFLFFSFAIPFFGLFMSIIITKII